MNEPIDRPDSALRAWLELGPERGRPEALERALAATRRVPQRPGWSFPERWLPVNRALLTAAATLIVVIGAAVVFRPATNVGPSTSPAPTATTGPAATTAPVAVAPSGGLDPGTHSTSFFAPRLGMAEEPTPVDGALRFTVPDGWALAGDHTSDVQLVRSTGQATGIEAWIRPTANRADAGCDAQPNEDVNPVVGPLAESVRTHPGLTSSPVHEITIDGHIGRWMDVGVSPTWTQTCSGEPTVALITENVFAAGPVGAEPYLVGISGERRMRIVFLDIGPHGNFLRDTVMILVTAPDQATFDSFVDDAMEVVQSFHFE